MDRHSENDTGRNCLVRAQLQRCRDLSSCTLADLLPFERPVGVSATSSVFFCFYDRPCSGVLSQRLTRFFCQFQVKANEFVQLPSAALFIGLPVFS